MDISLLSDSVISSLAGACLHAYFACSATPGNVSARKQRKMRKLIYTMCIKQNDDISDELRRYLTECNDDEFSAFFDRCVDECKVRRNRREDQLRNELFAFDEGVQSALIKLTHHDYWPAVRICGSDAEIRVEDTLGYIRALTLTDAEGIPQNKEGYFLNEISIKFQSETNRYCLYGELEEPIENNAFPFAITFGSAKVSVFSYNACEGTSFWDDPWDYLRSVSFSIGMKADIPGDYCNKKEIALLPLIREIVSLEYWMELPDRTVLSFEHLKALSKKYNADKAFRLLDQLERKLPGSPEYTSLTRKLLSLLSMREYAPMWREVYEKLKLSQNGYPNKTEAFCPANLLYDIRTAIQKKMEANGYIGEYPDFTKDAYMRGIHLESSYNNTYFVGMQRSRYYIHCTESYEAEDNLTIQFLCGTALLKKDEDTSDVYDCIFNAKGKRIFHMMHHQVMLGENGNDPDKADDLETDLDIAVKKAECRKLTKNEKQIYYGKMIPGFGLFFWIFLIAGGMFGILMTTAMMLVCSIATALIAGISTVPEMMASIPWWQILAVGWIGFGGAMGIIMLKAARK